MTARSVPATVACFFSGLSGPAAAGIAKFFGGRAFLPVAYAFFMLLVALPQCAGVPGAVYFSGHRWLVLVDFVCSCFWHCVTMGMDFPCYNYTYAHK